MQKIFYPFDAPAFWFRTAIVAFFVGMPLALGVLILLSEMELPRELVGGIIAPPMILLLIWELALPLFIKQRLDDGLRIDEHGVTRVLAGREETWRWEEVSEFRLHSGWHPMSLLIGRSITFRGPRPARRSRLAGLVNRIAFFGRNLAFGDNYVALPKELADRLNRYRDIATGVAPRPASAEIVRAPEPVMFMTRDSLDPVKRGRAVLIIVGTAALFSAAALGLVMWKDGGLPGSIGDFVTSEHVTGALFPAFFILVQSLGQHFWQMSPANNLVMASHGGVHLRRGLIRKFWRWDEVEDIAVKDAPPAPGKQETVRTVSFIGSHEGMKPGKPAPEGEPHAYSLAFDDIYESPPDELARELEEWASWGRAHLGPVSQEAAAAAAAASTRPTMAATRFQMQMGRPSAFSAPITILFWAMLLGSMAMTMMTVFASDDAAPSLAYFLTMMGISLGALFGGLALFLFGRGGGANHLEIDADGLTYRRLGLRQWYGWHELSGFELRSVALRWGWRKRTVILFSAPRDDRISRFVRWAYRIEGVLPRVVVEDVYEIATAEILTAFQQRMGRRGKQIPARPAA